MKKTLIILSAFFALCIFSSCNKEPKNEHPLEGVWAFMSDEYVSKDGETIVHQGKQEYDPFHPSTDNDMKLEITWVSENDYSAQSFAWNPDGNSWESMGQPFGVSIRDGNKFFAEVMDGKFDEIGIITISADTFTIETTRVLQSIFGDSERTEYRKETYKRMK
jgi:hypothetical protein